MLPSLLAAAPIVTVLVLMLAAGWPAARAGVSGLLIALVIVIAAADAPLGDLPALSSGVIAEAGFFTLTILWILWPALALHHLQEQGGAMADLRRMLAGLAPHPFLQALLIGWFLALFLEGSAGFGTPVALVAPLLAGLGMPPVRAVVVALLGHAAGVSFGALGTPLATLSAITGLPGGELAWRTALLNAAVAFLVMMFLVRNISLAGNDPGSPTPRLRTAAWATLAVLAFIVPGLATAIGIGPELPTLAGALLGGTLFTWLARLHAPRGDANPGPLQWQHLPWSALAPYFVLITLVLATRAVPWLTERLEVITIEWRLWDRFEGRVQPLLNPGSLLMIALVVGWWIQARTPRDLRVALLSSAKRLLPVAGALLAMLSLSRLMLHAGMIETLQATAFDSVGQAWPVVAPAVGALGAFVTGSATASNVLFGSLQVQTAQSLGLSPEWIAAGQAAGAGIGNIVSPHNVVAGAAAVGLAGREAIILRHTVVPCLAALMLLGLMLWVVPDAA